MSVALNVVYYQLSNYGSLTGMVSTRIYPNVAEQGAAYPLIVFSGVGRFESPTQDDDSAIDTHRVQVDLFAIDTASASAISQLTRMSGYVRAALARVTGTIDGILVNGIQSAGEGDEYDTELKVHRKRLDFLIRLTMT